MQRIFLIRSGASTKKTRRVWLIVGVTLLAALTFATSVSAQEGTGVTDDEVNEVSSHLYCPICENVPLDVCPTQACADWRAEVRALLEEGATEQEVQNYFVERYGVRVLGEPPRTGFTALVWVLPLVGLVIGAALLGRSLIQIRRAPQRAPAAGDTTAHEMDNRDAAYVARLERELKDFRL